MVMKAILEEYWQNHINLKTEKIGNLGVNLSTSEMWKVGLTMVQTGGFEHRTFTLIFCALTTPQLEI